MPRKKKTEAPAANAWGKILTGDANEYLPLFEFANGLKLKEEYLIGLAKSGRLKAFKIDDYWLSTSQWVNEWLEEVKNNLHQEISDKTAEPAGKSEIAFDIVPALPKKNMVAKAAKIKTTPSFYKEIDVIKRELLEEIEKEDNKDTAKKWVHYVEDNNSFKAILGAPLRLSFVPQQTSHNHYALILALFLVVAAGLFIYTTALAGF